METDYFSAGGVRLELVDDDGLLFDAPAQKLYRIDRPSAFVWSALAATGGSAPDAAKALAEQGGATPHQAEAFIETCLSQWRALGLLDVLCEAPAITNEAQSLLRDPWPGSGTLTPICYEAAGVIFGVAFADARVQDAVEAVIGHLRQTRSQTVDAAFWVRPDGGGYVLEGTEAERRRLADAEAVAVNLKNDMLSAVLRLQRGWIALHGSSLKTPSGAIVLAGPSGSGKSTIGALLNLRGWPLIADDVLLVDTASSEIRGLPFAFAAKPESWSALTQALPELKALPAQVRPDGRTVKYITPRETAPSQNSAIVRRIIFPTFQSGGDGVPRPLPRSEALSRLMQEGHNFDRRLSADGFSSLCRVVAGAEILSLSYADPVQAAERLMSDNGSQSSFTDEPLAGSFEPSSS